MDAFIKKIFEIDNQAQEYQQSLDDKKEALLQERKQKIQELDAQFLRVLEEENKNLEARIKETQENDQEKLNSYKVKAENIQRLFEEKKSHLVKQFSTSILESGD